MPIDDLPAAYSDDPSAALLAGLTDALPWPLLLLGTAGHLVHANAAAMAILRRSRPLRLTSSGLVEPSQRGCRAAFSQALTQAFAGAPSALRWAGRGASPWALLSPMSAQGKLPQQVLLALARDVSHSAELAHYAAAHRFTAAETRVLKLLAQGHGVASVAGSLGVAVTTVRSQVVALRRKTGHRRLSTLLLELAAMPSFGSER